MDLIRNIGKLVLFQFRVHGQRKHTAAELFRHGKITFPVSQVPVGILKMQGKGVIDRGGDSLLLQPLFQRIPFRGTYPQGVLVEDMGGKGGSDGELDLPERVLSYHAAASWRRR